MTTQRFVVTNTGDAAQTFTLTAINAGLPAVGSATPASAAIAPGQSAAVTVSTTAPLTNLTAGRVWLRAAAGAVKDSAFTEVTAQTPPTLGTGVTLVNPTGVSARALCLTIAAGPGAAGLTTQASYNTRGLVTSTVTLAPFGGGNATTAITWDPTWDLPATTTDATGVSSYRTYDAATGNLLSARVGADPSRTTTFAYDATTKQLVAVYTPGIGVPDRIAYDPDLGNVRQTTTPRGVAVTAYKDQIGRDTLVVSSVDTILGTATALQRQRILYDAAGRVRETSTNAPAMSYTMARAPLDPTPVLAETLVVRTTYDPEGHVLTLNAFSEANLGVWDMCVNPVGICAGVPRGTEGSYDIRTYDWVGRLLTQRLSSRSVNVTYDPAGNVVSDSTKNGYTITSTYDAANRLVKRIVPSVTYAQEFCDRYAPGPLGTTSPPSPCRMQFPIYPTAGGTSLVIPADTVRFAFDAAGRLSRADNKDARIARSWYPGGALKTDTLRTRSYGTSAFTTTVFGSTRRTDLTRSRLTEQYWG